MGRLRHPAAATALLIAGICALCPRAETQPGGDAAQKTDAEFQRVRGGIFVLASGGGNITASAGPDGILLVNSGVGESTPAVLAALKRLEARLAGDGMTENAAAGREAAADTEVRAATGAGAPALRFLLNTGPLPGLTGGNARIVAATASTESGIAVIAHDNVLVRLVDAGQPFDMLPTHTVGEGEFDLMGGFNGESVRLAHMPLASTDADLIVYFRGSDVICTGSVFSMETFPIIDVARGGSIDGSIRALDYVLSLAIPGPHLEGGTLIVPADGRLADSADVGRYRDMLAIIRDQVRHLIESGMTLAQVKAANPAAGYEARFGAATGPWTTERFVEAVYRSLAEGP